jgi:hypothetical protein
MTHFAFSFLKKDYGKGENSIIISNLAASESQTSSILFG